MSLFAGFSVNFLSLPSQKECMQAAEFTMSTCPAFLHWALSSLDNAKLSCQTSTASNIPEWVHPYVQASILHPLLFRAEFLWALHSLSRSSFEQNDASHPSPLSESALHVAIIFSIIHSASSSEDTHQCFSFRVFFPYVFHTFPIQENRYIFAFSKSCCSDFYIFSSQSRLFDQKFCDVWLLRKVRVFKHLKTKCKTLTPTPGDLDSGTGVLGKRFAFST